MLFGTLAAISADNLGSLALGGFKESCIQHTGVAGTVWLLEI